MVKCEKILNSEVFMSDTLQILIAMIIYMTAVILIGVFYAKRANKNSEAYFLGGRSLGPWVTAMSAEASDMSGWLLMGLPGGAYWCGLADAAWTAIGLAICYGGYSRGDNQLVGLLFAYCGICILQEYVSRYFQKVCYQQAGYDRFPYHPFGFGGNRYCYST